MENLELHTPTQPGQSDLQAQCNSLRHLVLAVLVLLVVFGVTADFYLLRQVKWTRTDLEGLRAQAGPMFNEYRTIGPKMDEFLKKVADYGHAHPDFAPIMEKYGLNKAAPPAATAPAATAPASKAKK